MTVQRGLGVAARPGASARSSGAVVPLRGLSKGWLTSLSISVGQGGWGFHMVTLHSSLEKRWNLPDFLKPRPKAGTALPLSDPCVGLGTRPDCSVGVGSAGVHLTMKRN